MAVNLDELERLAEAATAGPWRERERCNNAEHKDACGIVSERTCCETIFKDQACPRAQHGRVTIFQSDAYDECTHPIGRADAQFIAAANPMAVLELIAIVRLAQKLLPQDILVADLADLIE